MQPGTGVLLNNEMDDFVLKSGVANLYGLTGSAANAIAAGKRPLSSMTPAFLETDAAVVVLGTLGGSRIITMVLLAALEVAHGRGGPSAAGAAPFPSSISVGSRGVRAGRIVARTTCWT